VTPTPHTRPLSLDSFAKESCDDDVEELLLLWVKRRQHEHPKEGNGGGGGPSGGPIATPFLVIPSATGDTGARPIPVGQAVTNASIQATLTVSPGTNQWLIQLSCTVANLGVAGAAAGLAEFYVGDLFSVWNASHESLTSAQVKANAQLVGYVAFLAPAGASTTVACPKLWTPTVGSQGSADAQKGILVQVYDALSDRLTTPFDALLDRHVARNDQLMDPIIF
jgi:hypothetical protein